MARLKDLAINLDSLSQQDWVDARRIMELGGVDLGAVDLAAVQAAPTSAPVPVLAALIYVDLRRDSPRITPKRCVRLALDVSGRGATDGN